VPAWTRRPLRLVALLAAAVVVAAGCQVQLVTTVQVDPDGSGSVTQAIGFDDAALARVGNVDEQLHVGDLEQAGWTVDEPVKEGDTTWVRAHRAFDDADEANAVLAQLSGPEGPYRDLYVTRRAGLLSTTTEVTGTLDLSGGVAIFGDQQLTDALGGDPSGGLVARVEAEEGRPVSDMVDVVLTVDLPDAEESIQGRPGDGPQTLEVSSTDSHLLSVAFKALIVVLVVLTGAVIALRARVRRRRRKRMMRSSTRRLPL
jgi:hypothetical protein